MRRLSGLFFILALLVTLANCTTTQQNASYQGAGLGAAVGAAAGALLDDDNPWRGAVIGAAAGAVLGGGITEISKRASQDAAANNRPVVYTQGNTVVEATPLAYNQHTKCHKIRKRVWRHGRLVQDRVEEVCEGEKISNTY
ncbi:MAG TPA: glycine zipper 2TM domain-containing protein [Thermodesulfatator atlanticus]|uniref:Glycine zipper 2TM domain-containing protein n=1 Tax=Thermodesulfatator atlanticus TaxID=501497 RepID=A0A7V5P1D7_9BACT|nr:glycine zipper 2TM domain-containing protein [Thermodesulfatator atlanticus]